MTPTEFSPADIVSHDFNEFTLHVEPFAPFEWYVLSLSESDVRQFIVALRNVILSDQSVPADWIALRYLEKRQELIEGPFPELFYEMNVESLTLYRATPGLTHVDLQRSVLSAWFPGSPSASSAFTELGMAH